jgi:hypothetical protein
MGACSRRPPRMFCCPSSPLSNSGFPQGAIPPHPSIEVESARLLGSNWLAEAGNLLRSVRTPISLQVALAERHSERIRQIERALHVVEGQMRLLERRMSFLREVLEHFDSNDAGTAPPLMGARDE